MWHYHQLRTADEERDNVRGLRGTAVLAGAIGVAAAGWAAPASAATGCRPHGRTIAGVRHSRITQSSGTTIVYRTRGSDSDAYWACRRGRPGRVLIGYDDSFQQGGSEYGATTLLSDFHIAGPWVIAVNETGEDQAQVCTKYQPGGPCPGPTDALLVANVARRLDGILAQIAASTTDASGNVTNLSWARTLVSAAGAVAWLQSGTQYAKGATQGTPMPSSLEGCVVSAHGGGLGCTPKTLDTGALGAAALQLNGTTLNWQNAGQAKTASL
jgi:hypothetical protein